MYRRMIIAGVCFALVAWIGAVTTSAGAPQNSEQVVFSGIAAPNTASDTPAGFWIWCEADSGNPYAGECRGAMYFYALGITESVIGEITENGPHLYTMNVHSADSSIVCTLSNPHTPTRGPKNEVDVSCSAPPDDATSFNAVVNVTGP
jgi:hypothetical protein